MAQVHDTRVRISVSLDGEFGKVCDYVETFRAFTRHHPEHAELMAGLVAEIGIFRARVNALTLLAGLEKKDPQDARPGTL